MLITSTRFSWDEERRTWVDRDEIYISETEPGSLVCDDLACITADEAEILIVSLKSAIKRIRGSKC